VLLFRVFAKSTSEIERGTAGRKTHRAADQGLPDGLFSNKKYQFG
jgi:hypothetical protein